MSYPRYPQDGIDEPLEGLCSIAQPEQHYGVFVQTEGCRDHGFRYVPRRDQYLVVSAHQVDGREYFLPREHSRKVLDVWYDIDRVPFVNLARDNRRVASRDPSLEPRIGLTGSWKGGCVPGSSIRQTRYARSYTYPRKVCAVYNRSAERA